MEQLAKDEPFVRGYLALEAAKLFSRARSLRRIVDQATPDDTYYTGTGQALINVHKRTASCDSGCVIHNPTDPHREWPTHWRANRLMERICPCGVGHPDKDALAFIRRSQGATVARAAAVHGCCGCCKTPRKPISFVEAMQTGASVSLLTGDTRRRKAGAKRR